MRQNDRRRAKWAIDRWRLKARMSLVEGDSGEEGSASDYDRAENGSQEVGFLRLLYVEFHHTLGADINI